MDFSTPTAGMQSASAAFDSAANAITQAFSNSASDPLSAGSTMGDSVDLSTAVAALLKSNLDFTANIKMAIVENQMNQSTFSILA